MVSATDKVVATATYSDFRIIRTRSTAQIVLEIPLEQAQDFIDRFGIPIPGNEIHVAIARLVKQSEPEKTEPNNERSERAKEAYRNMPEWEQARVRAVQLCKDRNFQNWALKLSAGKSRFSSPEEHARQIILGFCSIKSRREIATDERAYKAFIALEQEYRQAVGLAAEQRG